MSPITKSVLVIVATFAIGIVVGALLDATLARDRMEQVREFRGGSNLQALERLIEPTDEEQREAIRAVLERASARHARVFERTRIDMEAEMDSLRAELEPLLTEEQKARLDRFRPGSGRMRGGPGRRAFPRGPDGVPRGRLPADVPFERDPAGAEGRDNSGNEPAGPEVQGVAQANAWPAVVRIAER